MNCQTTQRQQRKLPPLPLILCVIAVICFPSHPLFAEEDENLTDVWVAVGYGGRRMISTDGLNWLITEENAQSGKDDRNNLMSVVFAKDKFVTTGGGSGGDLGPGGRVITSLDGRLWHKSQPMPNRINPIVFGDGRFVAGAPGRTLIWSEDAEKWNTGATIRSRIATHFRHGAYGNGTFVFIGNHGGRDGAHWVATSKNGETIEDFRADLPVVRAIVFAEDLFVIVGEAGVCLSSADGAEWKACKPLPFEDFEWVIHTGEEFVCGGDKNVYTSTDAENWSRSSMTVPGRPLWTDGTRWISTAWPGKMHYSGDGGTTWEASPSMTPNGINKVARGRL